MPDDAPLLPLDPARHPATITVVPRDGSAPQELAPEEAERAFRSGIADLPQMQGRVQIHGPTLTTGGPAKDPRVWETAKYRVRRPDGTIVAVPALGLDDEIDAGGHLTSEQVARSEELQKHAEGASGAARSFLTSLAGQATLGLASPTQPEIAELDRAAQEAHPIARIGGQIAGLVAGAKALPLGAGAEAGAGALAARAGAGARVAGGIAQAARAATESIELAHADMLTEDALNGGNHKLTAEHYVSTLGKAALYGAALGAAPAVMGAGARSVGRLFSEARPSAETVQRVANQTFGYEAKGVGDLYARATSALAGGGEDIIRDAAKSSKLRATLLDATEGVETERNAAERAMREHVNTLKDDSDDLAQLARGDMKAEQVARSVSSSDPIKTAAHSYDTILTARERIAELRADVDEYGHAKELTRLDNELARYEKEIKTAWESPSTTGPAADQFIALDKTKRAIQQLEGNIGRARPTEAGGIRQQSAVWRKLEDVQESLRKNLENEDVWGKAGADQKRINAAWSRQIAASKQFGAQLTTKTGEDWTKLGWRRHIFEADPAKINRYVSGLVNPNNDLVHETVREYIDSTQAFTKAIGDSYELAPEDAARVARVNAAADALRATMRDMQERLAKVNQFKALLDKEGHGHGAAVAGALLGGIVPGVGHIGGAILGAASETITKPGKTILRLAQLERMAGKMNGRVDAAVSKMLAPLAPVGRLAGRAVRPAAETQYEDYARRQRMIADNTPHRAAARTSDIVEPIHEHAPTTAKAVGAVVARASAFLASKLPAKPSDDPLARTTGRPSAIEVAKFNRIAEAVEDPVKVLERGHVTPDETEALRTVYPELFASAQKRVAEALALPATKLDYQQRVRLALTFDLPLASDAAIRHAQATLATPEKPTSTAQPKGGKALAESREVRTRSEQIESR